MPWNLVAVPDRKPTSPMMRPLRINTPKPKDPPRPPKPPAPEGYVQRWQK